MGGGGALRGALALLPLLGRSRFGWLVLLAIVAVSVAGGLGVGVGGGDGSPTGVAQTTGANDPKHFVGFVLDDTQSTWHAIFAARGRQYRNAHLVLFTGATSTACGAGRAASGPFYCPSDERVYIDLSFYDELAQKFGAAGDFAEAYVIAHEIGHHVQNQLGLTRAAERGAEGTSVRIELQADCFAGIWARSTQQRGLLEPGDVDEALRAAASVGDDRLQRAATGTIHPESFTHGSAAQRARWLRRGLDDGTLDGCDTFRAKDL